MPRLSRKKNIRKRKSYRKQSTRNRKVRKSLKGGNLTPLSTSKNVLCNFEGIYGDITVNDIYGRKTKSGQLVCDNLYYLNQDDKKFYKISDQGQLIKGEKALQEDGNFYPIIESVHGEVLLKPKKLKPINIKTLKGKKKNIMSRNNSQSLLRRRSSCRNIKPGEISILKNILLDKQRGLKEDKIELDKDLCHFYYNGVRNKGYLTDGSVKELKELKESKKNNRRTSSSPRRQTRALPSLPKSDGEIIYTSTTPSPSPSSSPRTIPVYADPSKEKGLLYTSLAFSPPSSGTVSLKRNTPTIYTGIEGATDA